MTNKALEISSPVGLIAAGGVMPFAVADSLTARGIDPVVFALRGACDPVAVERFRHHWISIGQLGRAVKLFRAEKCRKRIPKFFEMIDQVFFTAGDSAQFSNVLRQPKLS